MQKNIWRDNGHESSKIHDRNESMDLRSPGDTKQDQHRTLAQRANDKEEGGWKSQQVLSEA